MKYNKARSALLLTIFIVSTSYIMMIAVNDFCNDMAGIVHQLTDGRSPNKINDESKITVKKPVCNISHWRNGCNNMKHYIYSNKAIDFIELLYEENDTKEYLYNCTSYLTNKNNTVKKICVGNSYTDIGTIEVWWSNITIGKHNTMCYFITEKQLMDNSYVDNKDNIKSFIVMAPSPKTVFSGYFKKQSSNDINDYNAAMDMYRGMAPVCIVHEYYDN